VIAGDYLEVKMPEIAHVHELASQSSRAFRRCLRDPIPEIEQAAVALERAVEAHLAGAREMAFELLCEANANAVREWTESIWGKGSTFVPKGPYWSAVPRAASSALRMPGAKIQAELHARDGYYCRFCGIPVVRRQVRELLRRLYPEVLIWGRKNSDQHAALQCMWAQYDHLLPHSRGGSNDLSNLVVTCAPCNFGRMQYTLEEASLWSPLDRPPRTGEWRGLEKLVEVERAKDAG
jgi:hypothetical protein